MHHHALISSFMSLLLLKRSPLPWDFSNTNEPIQYPHSQSLFLLGSHILGYYKPALFTSKPGTRQLGAASMYQSLKANSTPIYRCPLLPEENNALSICLVTNPGTFPGPWLAIPFSLGNYNELSSQWQPFPNLLTLLYFTFSNNTLYLKTFMLGDGQISLVA